jgi:hypothetical protein
MERSMRFGTLVGLLAGAGLLVVTNARATTLTQTLTGSEGMPPNSSPTASTDPFIWTITWSGLGTPSAVAHVQMGPPGLPGSTRIDLSGADAIDLLSDFIQDLPNKPDPPGAIRGQLVATPEPATAVLLGASLALVGLALAQRRRRG